ncbi:MAG: alkaline phosphatase family protein [Chloroflexi bacterium]|nr:alkaline phosphatase family protein [Chloroflexota bacterium]
MSVIFLFVDGVGIGVRDPAVNPFAVAHLPVLRGLLGDLPFLDRPSLEGAHALVIPLDANLDIDGLPQSGTGQTTLLTGVNAPAHINEHYGPYPDERLGKLLENNIYHRVLDAGGTAAFANAYPAIFMDRIERGTDRRSAMAQAPANAGLPYRGHADLAAGRAVSASLTNERWPHADSPSLITAHEAGRNFERLSRDYDLTLFEFFLTDVAGHRPARISAVAILERLDEFIGGIVELMDLQNSLLVVTSDHGNIEDNSTRRHTRNPVPAILVGSGRHEAARRMHSLADVAPAILHAIGLADAG